MKKNYILAALAVLAVSCQINPDIEQEVPQGVTIYLNGEKPEPEAQSKTYYDTDAGTVLWSQTGEKLAVAISNSATLVEDRFYEEKVPQVAGFMSSNEAEVSKDGKTATFSITFEPKTSIPSGGTYRFHTVYPESANFGLGNLSYWDWGVFVGTRQDEMGQFPPEGSFDPAADVMLGISKEACTEISDGMQLDLIFERLVTHGKITLSGLTPEIVVTKAVIKAPGHTLSGIYYINVMNKDLSCDKSNRDHICLNYTPAPVGNEEKKSKASAIGRPVGSEGTFDLWFCTQPTELAPGEPLAIRLYSSEGVIERTITANSKGIKFEKNKLSTLKVNMSERPLTPYYCEIQDAEGNKLDKLEMPRTGGKTTFYVKTNAGNTLIFNTENSKNIFSLTCGEGIEAEDGSVRFECVLIRKPNHSIYNKIEENIPVSVHSFGTQNYSCTLSFSQACGEGSIVNLADDWTADPVQFGSLLWYPVNVGFNRSHPYGKYFQYRRYAGQYPYCDDNSTKYAEASYNTGEGADYSFKGTPDDDTFYGSQYWWEYLGYPLTTPVWDDKYWPDVTTEESKAKGIGNPCPEGWRLPTREECTEFLKNTIGWKIKRTVTSHCGASFTGNAYVWEFWNKDMDEYMEFPIAGYINGTYSIENSAGNITDYRAITETDFKELDNASLKRYGNPDGYDYSYYWVSDPYNWEPSAIELNSRGYSNDVELVNCAWPGWGCSVRCVKPVK